MWFQKQKEPLKGSGFPRLKELVAYYKSEWLTAAKLKPSLADTPITILGPYLHPCKEKMADDIEISSLLIIILNKFLCAFFACLYALSLDQSGSTIASSHWIFPVHSTQRHSAYPAPSHHSLLPRRSYFQVPGEKEVKRAFINLSELQDSQ